MLAGASRFVCASGECEVDLDRRELRLRGVAVPIGGRAFEILEVLVRSAGELVTKDELMDRVWPGAIVLDNTLQVHIVSLRRALGRHRALLKTEAGRGYRLLGEWSPRDQVLAPRPLLDVSPITEPGEAATNFPSFITPLIGRSTALELVRKLVSAHRVVTLTGPGGIGKTTLALHVALALFPEFADGGWLVELASLSDPDLVPSAVASVLRLNLSGSETSAATIAGAINDRNLLLILDNCEHVIDAAANLAEMLVRSCPRVAILTTSREVLRIEGEYVYRVLPLDVPAYDDLPNALDHSAIELFVARVQSLDTGFSPDADRIPLIASICRHLDGIPLAIEFAAARVATLGLGRVAEGLEDRFRLLTRGRRTALPRHQTLRATLDWSYDLLTEEEQSLFRRLAIFPAGFTLDAAAAIMKDALPDPSVITGGIANLVAKSLVALNQTTPVRLQLLETNRAYALAKLSEEGEASETARRHAEFFRDLFMPDNKGPALPAPDDVVNYDREIGNVRSAVDWAFSPTGERMIGVALTAAFAPGWMHPWLAAECRERTERALDHLETGGTLGTPLLFRLHLALGLALSFTMGPVDQANAVLAKALGFAEELDDVDAQLRTLWAQWNVQITTGEYNAGHPVAEQFARVAARTGDQALALVGDRIIGVTLHYGGRQDEARHRLERVLQLYVVPPEQGHTTLFQFDQHSLARGMLARVLWLQGYAEQAISQARLSLAEAEVSDPGFTQSWLLHHVVCPLALMSGDFAEAERAIGLLKSRAVSLSAAHWTFTGHWVEARLLVMRGEFATASALLQTELARSASTGWEAGYPEFKGTHAQALAGLGRVAEAIAALDDGLARAEICGERYCVAELQRIKGEMLLQTEKSAAAEACFAGALAVARAQGALFWELRAARSFARLRISQGRETEAREVLAPVYERFTEGFETVDLRAARAILEEIAAPD
jgi:predicted ATPase/DNA-binding winged helix-turn-helix (wHTH) protein